MVQRVCLKHFKKPVKVLEDIIANSDSHQARISAITAAADRVGRLLQRLGLSRLTRDVTTSLREHILDSKPPEEEP
jgi:hypothetical protein